MVDAGRKRRNRCSTSNQHQAAVIRDVPKMRSRDEKFGIAPRRLTMELILMRDVPSLGKKGEIVKVASGYGRNFLIPRGDALPSSNAAGSWTVHRNSTR